MLIIDAHSSNRRTAADRSVVSRVIAVSVCLSLVGPVMAVAGLVGPTPLSGTAQSDETWLGAVRQTLTVGVKPDRSGQISHVSNGSTDASSGHRNVSAGHVPPAPELIPGDAQLSVSWSGGHGRHGTLPECCRNRKSRVSIRGATGRLPFLGALLGSLPRHHAHITTLNKGGERSPGAARISPAASRVPMWSRRSNSSRILWRCRSCVPCGATYRRATDACSRP